MFTQQYLEPIAALLNPVSIPVMPLAAIWLTKPVMTDKNITRRITEGDRVLIENNELKDCLGDPTHQITGCYGKPTSDFYITVIDLKTQEIIKIQL